MIFINIDTREKNLYNNIINRDLDKYKSFISVEFKTLNLGDIEIITDSNNFIIERKTLSDLNSSIIDGRYKEQKLRLLSNYNHNNITYIIEGDTIIKSLLKDNKKISSAYFSILYRDNIKLIFTNNIDETATFILSLCCKIIDNPDKYKKNENEINYIENVKIKQKKIENITPDICFIMQLSQIPTISHTIAKNIANKYNNFKILITEIDKIDSYDNKIKLLTNIDKIGTEKAKKILEYLNMTT
jgi:ERCC4-type nuclease